MHGAPRALRQDRPQARSERVRRLGVDVGGTFTDLIYVDDDAGRSSSTSCRRRPTIPSQGTVQGIKELAELAGTQPVGAGAGLPRNDDRDQHRDRAQRRAGRADHDRGLPRHPPHRAAQEAAQLLELPGPAVAAVPDRPPPLPADRARADHARRLGARAARRGQGARAGAPAEGGGGRVGRRLLPLLVPRTRSTRRASPRSSARSSPTRSSRSRRRCCRSTASTSASRPSA